MDQQKQSAIDRLKQGTNVLVTVNSNPTVDQLAACIGLTLMLNALGKHGTAVFSGTVPSTLEFLQPEKTLEKNTDSLRDFIISLDKSKADKLRYKVEDTVVKIFITPYRTSISDKDLQFSQGDFNVDVVVAIGVHDQKELDQAITLQGRILHDATIITLNIQPGNNLGTINWQDPQASSLSEMVASMVDGFDKKVLDNQVATALLTGIVAETERFSNTKTSPNTMKISAQLMAAGANQQLVATRLAETPQAPPPEVDKKEVSVPLPSKEPDNGQPGGSAPQPDAGSGQGNSPASAPNNVVDKLNGLTPLPSNLGSQGGGAAPLPPPPLPAAAPPPPEPLPPPPQPEPPKPSEGPAQSTQPPKIDADKKDDQQFDGLPPLPKLPIQPHPQIKLERYGQLAKIDDDRGFSQGSDTPSSSEDTDRPSGMPNTNQEFGFALPGADGKPQGNTPPDMPNPMTTPNSLPTDNKPILQHKNDQNQTTPTAGNQSSGALKPSEPLPTPPPVITSAPPLPPTTTPPPPPGVEAKALSAPPIPSTTQIPDFMIPPPGGEPPTTSAPATPPSPTKPKSSSPLSEPTPQPPEPKSEPSKEPESTDSVDDIQKLSDIEKELNSAHSDMPKSEDSHNEVKPEVDGSPLPEPKLVEVLSDQSSGDDKQQDDDEDNDANDDKKDKDKKQSRKDEKKEKDASTEPVGKLAEPLTEDDFKPPEVEEKSKPDTDKKESKKPSDMPLPEPLDPISDSKSPKSDDETPPPPVPPPMMPIPPTGQ